MPSDYAYAFAVVAALWLVGVFSRRAVRGALMNGARCLLRYPAIWRIPAFLGVAYVLFQLAAAALLHARLEEAFPVFAWNAAPSFAALAGGAGFAAAEHTAAVFTVFTATFPISAWFAFLFLLNRDGLLVTLVKTLARRFGRFPTTLLTIALLLCAVAAMLKPVVYLLLPEVLERVPLLVPMAVNALSGAFELLLGIYFLTYLMLMSHAWLRGIAFERRKLQLFAMRRTGFVLKWSLVLVAASAGLVLLPLYVGLWVAPGEPFYDQCAWFSTWIGGGAVTLLALRYLPVQAILVFHNESLRAAFRDGRQLFRRNWALILPFLVTAAATFFALATAADYLDMRLGSETLTAFAARALAAGIEGCAAGWLIASWVCLYKGFSPGRTGRTEVPF
jgi:hypothetical protein